MKETPIYQCLEYHISAVEMCLYWFGVAVMSILVVSIKEEDNQTSWKSSEHRPLLSCAGGLVLISFQQMEKHY